MVAIPRMICFIHHGVHTMYISEQSNDIEIVYIPMYEVHEILFYLDCKILKILVHLMYEQIDFKFLTF